MSKEKRGGARLDKNMSPKKETLETQQSSERAGHTKKTGFGALDRRARIALIVVAVVVTVILVAVVWYKNWAKLPDLPELPGQDDSVTGEIPSQRPGDGKRKKEFYTFLVVGRDTGGGGNTDTIMFCAYDVPNQKLAVMSIPRDTMVDAHHPEKNKKINAVWNLGLYYADKDSKKEGIDYLKEAVGEMTGITPDFHVIVNWEAFGRLVDAIGGVDFEVPFEMKYKDPVQDLVIDQAAGQRHLTGDDAMQVVRWRHNNSYSVQYADADLGRIRTQQALVKEIVKKCLKFENVTKINQLAEIFTEEVETDLTLGNLVAFAERAIFGGLNMDNVIFTTIPVEGANVNGASYVQVKPDEMLGLLNDSFNPYVEDLTMDDTHVLRYSSSRGYYVATGTGTGVKPTYSDPKPAQASVSKPTVSATPEPSETTAELSDGPENSGEVKPSGEEVPEGVSDDELVNPPDDEPSQEPEPTAAHTPDSTPFHDPMDMGIPMD